MLVVIGLPVLSPLGYTITYVSVLYVISICLCSWCYYFGYLIRLYAVALQPFNLRCFIVSVCPHSSVKGLYNWFYWAYRPLQLRWALVCDAHNCCRAECILLLFDKTGREGPFGSLSLREALCVVNIRPEGLISFACRICYFLQRPPLTVPVAPMSLRIAALGRYAPTKVAPFALAFTHCIRSLPLAIAKGAKGGAWGGRHL